MFEIYRPWGKSSRVSTNESRLRQSVAFGLLLIGLTIATAASAGLLGSIGGALGIGGDAGKALNKLDGLLPGGGGATDQLLGAPGAALTGESIKRWREANEATVDKLGQTNDRTVDRLITGLGKVQEGAMAGLSDNIDDFANRLDLSIDNLDVVLQASIDRLDASLTNQTGRLDTIFQKQTSTFFQLGQIFLTVSIIAGLFYALTRLVTSQPDGTKLSDLFKRARLRIGAVSLVSAGFLLLTWLWPDPSGIGKLKDGYVSGYHSAMAKQDFAGANYYASRLAIVDSNDPMVMSYDIKSRAFRDLFYRPTALLSRDSALDLLARLTKADEYYTDKKNGNDPEILTILALISAQSSTSNTELLRALVFSAEASQRYDEIAKRKDFDKLQDKASLEVFSEGNRDLLGSLRQAPVSLYMMRLAASNDEDEAIKLLSKYDQISRDRGAVPEALGPGRSNSYSSLAQLNDSIGARFAVVHMYRELTARYVSLQDVRINGAALGSAAYKQRYCALFSFYEKWHAKEFPRFSGDPVLTANILAGPFSLLARARSEAAAANMCSEFGISDSDLDKLAGFSESWLKGLEARSTTNRKGIAALRKTKEKLAGQQSEAFSTFENATEAMLTFGTKMAQAGVPANEAQGALIQWLSAGTLLGLYAMDGDEIVPIAEMGHKRFAKQTNISTDTWRQLAWQYAYASRL